MGWVSSLSPAVLPCLLLPHLVTPTPPSYQANAVAGPDLALWTAGGTATAEPFGDYGHKQANVRVQGFAIINALQGSYGRRNN